MSNVALLMFGHSIGNRIDRWVERQLLAGQSTRHLKGDGLGR
jgi:hypothetical protein